MEYPYIQYPYMRYHLEVIDGYKIDTYKSENGDGNDLKISFFHNHELFHEETYKNVSSVAEERVREKLLDNVSFNKGCLEKGDIHRTICFITLLFLIENAIQKAEESNDAEQTGT